MQTNIPDKSYKRVRFGCGASFGLFVGLLITFRYFLTWSLSWEILLPAVIIVAIICGMLATKYGDRFWI